MHPDLPAEQARLEFANECLARMRHRAERARSAATSSAATEVDGAIVAAHLGVRVTSLADSDVAPFFGRIDSDEMWYVGRRHVEDERGDPVVVDWRTDVAIPFYRATWADPMDLHLRRRHTASAHELTAIFDEDFADEDAKHGGGGVPDPLLAELERGRTGEMRDIVATIQTEQDEIIPRPARAVDGGAGWAGNGKRRQWASTAPRSFSMTGATCSTSNGC